MYINLVISSLLFVTVSNTSIYTPLSTEQCQIVAPGHHRCLGFAGYGLDIIDRDARDELYVNRNGKIYPLYLSAVVSPAFSYIGPRAEWRLKNGSTKSLIFRYNTQRDLLSNLDIVRYDRPLVITKLQPTPCVVAVVPAGYNQNERARRIADRVETFSCLYRQGGMK